MEFRTHKQVHYQIHFGSTCSYEIDDTPPFPLNLQALELGLKGTLLFDCSLVDEVHISRKQYLDGSIPTGFQRTSLLGIGGQVQVTEELLVPISHCCLEEDACREVSDEGHHIVFRTDRLGMPLLEVISQAIPMSPTQAQATAATIGHQLRWAQLVRRGSGATRQDVNVSITGGDRVEIKGVNRYQLIRRLVSREAFRQERLLALRQHLLDKGGSSQLLSEEFVDCTSIFGRTAWEPIASTLDQDHKLPDIGSPEYDTLETERGKVMAVILPGWKGLLDWEVQPGLTFANELAGRIRVIACTLAPYLLRPAQLVSMGILTSAEMVSLQEQLKLGPEDTFVILWGSQSDAQTAAEEVLARCRQAYDGIPQETRQVLEDGNTDFERVLPGPDRMYPDTDSRPIKLSPPLIEEYRSQLPPPLQVAHDQLVRSGLPADWARRLPLSEFYDLYRNCVGDGVPPRLAAWTCLELVPALRRKGFKSSHWLRAGIKDSPLTIALKALGSHPGGRDLMASWLKALYRGSSTTEGLKRELRAMKQPNPQELVSMKLQEERRSKGSAVPTRETRRLIAKIMLKNKGRDEGAEIARLVNEALGGEA